MNLLHIESRSSDRIPNQYEFFVECAEGGDIHKVIEILKETMTYCSVVSRNSLKDHSVEEKGIVFGEKSIIRRFPIRKKYGSVEIVTS